LLKNKTARFCGKIHQMILILPALVGYPQKQNFPEKRSFWKKF